MMAILQRALYAYSIHGRSRDGVIDYTALLAALASTPIVSRQVSVQDETVAITLVEALDDIWRLRFIAGGGSGPALTFFDPATGRESAAQGPTGSIPVRPTIVFIAPERRIAVIERRRPGLTALDVARALGALGVAIGFAHELVIDLNPVTAESFLDEIAELERIRKAAVVVAKPNFDWTDNATRLTDYASESNGYSAEVEITAGRGKSLAKDTGIVADIKNLVSNAIAPLKRVRIVGTHTDESKERAITLAQHQERQYAEIDTGTSQSDQEASVATAASELINRISTQSESSESSGGKP